MGHEVHCVWCLEDKREVAARLFSASEGSERAIHYKQWSCSSRISLPICCWLTLLAWDTARPNHSSFSFHQTFTFCNSWAPVSLPCHLIIKTETSADLADLHGLQVSLFVLHVAPNFCFWKSALLSRPKAKSKNNNDKLLLAPCSYISSILLYKFHTAVISSNCIFWWNLSWKTILTY